MFIDTDLCNGCGKCVVECHRSAISGDGQGKYSINPGLCTGCKDVFDIECIRICETRAITYDKRVHLEYDPTWRLRSEHLIWLIAVMGSEGSGAFWVGAAEWDAFRRLISAAYLDTELKVRLTKNFDDNCTGCPRKKDLDHVEQCGRDDDACQLADRPHERGALQQRRGLRDTACGCVVPELHSDEVGVYGSAHHRA